MSRILNGLLLLTALAAPSIAFAQSNELVTDRPDVAESSLTVGQGRFQIEMGVDLTMVELIGVDTSAFTAPTKLRYGVADGIEIHLESGLFTHTRVGSLEDTSFAGFDVGGKFHFIDGDGLVPSVGLLVAVGAPVDGALLDLRPTLAADFGLTDWLGLGTNLGLTIPITQRDSNGDELRWAASLGFDVGAFAPVPLGLYAELFGTVGLGAGGSTLSVDGGLTYGVLDWLQLDAYVRTQLDADVAPLGVGAGFSAKF